MIVLKETLISMDASQILCHFNMTRYKNITSTAFAFRLVTIGIRNG